MRKVSCFEIKETTHLPAFFWGKWVSNESFHDADVSLKIDCAPNEKGARFMTREQAIKESRKERIQCELCWKAVEY